jgi:hypothetical protein
VSSSIRARRSARVVTVATVLLGAVTAPPAGAWSGVASPSAVISAVTPASTPELTVTVDAAAPAAAQAATASPTSAAYPLDRTFLLHSKPGSRRTIFIDLDGASVTGTRWNAAVDGHAALAAGPQAGWSLDASPSFSDAERAAVQDLWQGVAEDFAPFDVDVTTEQPAADVLDRTSTGDLVYGTTALVTGGWGDAPRSTADDALCAGTCAGIAYNGVFSLGTGSGTTHTSWQPAFVFGERIGDAHGLADAVSHEVGHTLGLSHDGTASSDYYGGQGVWGPIMGSPSAYPVTQWSRGEYAGASRTEDDLAILGAAPGVPQRPDDVTDTVAAARAVPAPSGTPSATGLIGTPADVDVFALGTCTGSVTVSATPAAAYSPDVDLSLTVLGSDGTTLAGPVDQPTGRSSRSVATGLGASATVPAGTGRDLVVRVDGVGSGSASGTGYSDYGSLGRYLVGVTGSCSGAPDALPAVDTSDVLPGATVVTGDSPAAPVPAGPTAGPAVPTAEAALRALVGPSLRGAARVGGLLAVRPGTWSRPATLGYRWYVGGVAVPGAAGSTYRPRAAQVGRAVTARVTATTTGSGTRSRVVVTLRAGRVRR